MIRAVLFVLLVVGGSNLVESRRRQQDPRCITRGCPSGTTCRVVTRCPTPMSCDLVAECLATPPAHSHVGVCRIGDPILIEMNGRLRDTYCGPRLHCPDGTYCNTRLMDTYSTCCLSDPAGPVKPGRCPFNIYVFGGRSCFHTCNNDGDCLGSRKCCPDGCGSSCLPARRTAAHVQN
ncbi:hypothetical protein RRG08_040269 [Elysia crispata]|uniref:WAP domain-containing protein n=1 Tax=Elysia crispata TaxID=231223 RepID=A0AAE0YAA5_9GAST|nr:hypothetical protein RRG08_040269 [Elysia crispata]